MHTETETFTDIDDRYTLHLDGSNVRIERDAKTVYDGPACMLVATTLTRIAFGDQLERSGRTLFSHALRVANRCPDPHAYTVAMLHDIVEDTTVTLSDLGVFFEPRIVEAVDALTRRPTDSYAQYIERLRVHGPELARIVKIADLRDHLADTQAIPESLERRYRKALTALTDEPADD